MQRHKKISSHLELWVILNEVLHVSDGLNLLLLAQLALVLFHQRLDGLTDLPVVEIHALLETTAIVIPVCCIASLIT